MEIITFNKVKIRIFIENIQDFRNQEFEN